MFDLKDGLLQHNALIFLLDSPTQFQILKTKCHGYNLTTTNKQTKTKWNNMIIIIIWFVMYNETYTIWNVPFN